MRKMFIFLMTAMMLMNFALPSLAITFSDVADNSWFKTYVYDLAEKQVINGYTDGTFRPDNKVTVGEFLKLIIVASTGDKVNFSLVEADKSHWAAVYLKVAENYDVLNNGEYKISDLDRVITRIEIVKILTRCDILIKDSAQTASSKVFSDTQDLTEDELVYLSHAVGIGVIVGDPEGTFRPNDGLLRSECAKVIYAYTNR